MADEKPALSHVDRRGNANMVDVGSKVVSTRSATAEATVELSQEAAEAIRSNSAKKGDVLTVARIAGIGAAKRTDELIPLCHSVPIDRVSVEFDWQSSTMLRIQATAKATGKTGVEMEALVAASVAGLTVYDMCKAIDKGIRISEVQLVSKTGGKSGDYQR